MPLNKFKIYLMAIGAMSFWGFSFVWTKIVYEYLLPLSTIYLRLTFASLFLIAIKFLFKIKVKPDKGDMKLIFLLSITEPFMYFLGESFGMKYISSTLASVIISTIPVFSIIIAYLFANEKLNWLNIIGILISFSGILIMVLEPNLSLKESPIGIGLMMIAVFSAVFYTIFVKKLAVKYKPFTILIWQNIFGSLLFFPLFIGFEWSHFSQVQFDFRLATTLGQLIIFSSLLAFFLFIHVVNKLGITKTNVFTNFVPVVTAITAWILLPNENPSFKTGVGIIVVILGIYFSQLKLKSKRLE